MPSTLTYAYQKKANKVIHILDAQNGLKCDCICLSCGAPLEAVHGKLRDSHFRHHANKGCEGATETILHFRAKELLRAGNCVMTPSGKISYTDAETEQYQGNFRPDVTFWVKGKRWFVEIIVTNRPSAKKREIYDMRSEEILLIDLSDVSYDIEEEDLKTLIFEDIYNKSFLNPFEQFTPPYASAKQSKIRLLDALFFIVCVIGLYFFTRPKRQLKTF